MYQIQNHNGGVGANTLSLSGVMPPLNTTNASNSAYQQHVSAYQQAGGDGGGYSALTYNSHTQQMTSGGGGGKDLSSGKDFSSVKG